MRKQNKIILWPMYFDSTKTRKQGRKTPKNTAIPAPTQDELTKATQKIRLQSQTITDARHPKTPWQKTGFIISDKSMSKTQTIRRISKELTKARAQSNLTSVSK